MYRPSICSGDLQKVENFDPAQENSQKNQDLFGKLFIHLNSDVRIMHNLLFSPEV
jgi:hypothetical protein